MDTNSEPPEARGQGNKVDSTWTRRKRKFFLVEIPLTLVSFTASSFAMYYLLLKGFSLPSRSAFVLFVPIIVVLLLIVFAGYRQKYRQLFWAKADSGESRIDSDDGLTRFLQGRTFAKLIYWNVAIFFLVPVLTFTYSHVLLFFIGLVSFLFGGLPLGSTRTVANVVMVICAICSVATVIVLWRPYRKHFVQSQSIQTSRTGGLPS